MLIDGPDEKMGTGRFPSLVAGFEDHTGWIWNTTAMIKSMMIALTRSIQLRLYSHHDMAFLPS